MFISLGKSNMRSFRRFSNLIQTDDIVKVGGRSFEIDSMTNVKSSVLAKIDENLIQREGHPLERTKRVVYEYFKDFYNCDMLDPIVSPRQNFDDLGFPVDHVGRKINDSYYINKNYMLRTHMTAHEQEFLQKGHSSFLLCGKVFRRDEIDSTHYPVFHQLEGVKLFDSADMTSACSNNVLESVLMECQVDHKPESALYVLEDLQRRLNGLLRHLFGSAIPIRWQSCYFPFTRPSLEVEIEYRGKWVEVLGSGILQNDFLKNSGGDSKIAWAFGLGLERIAMILYDIPDIRLFWSQDERFLSQFYPNIADPITFKPYSKYPHTSRDLSFWVNDLASFSPNDLFDIVRSIAGDIVESVEQIDKFEKDKITSLCYRITYRSMEKSLTDEEVNIFQEKIRKTVASGLNIVIR